MDIVAFYFRPMILSPVKHYYSKSAIEAWFRNLSQDWERYFTPGHLKKGREIYLSNGIREIELTVEDAIVQCESNARSYYSVISWDKMGPSVRSSSKKRDRAQAIAIAGIYQIEELIADQLAELSMVDDPADPSDLTTGEGSALSGAFATDADEGFDSDGNTQGEATRGRSLLLTFRGIQEGLSLEACWMTLDGLKEDALAFGQANNQVLSEADCESLIRLTTMARAAGFVLDKVHNRFVMSDIGRFIPFLSHALPKWKSHFTIVRETEVTRLMQGIQSVEVEAFVQEAGDEGSDSYEIEWKFHAGGRTLSPEEADKLNRKGGQPIYLPERGILQLTDSQVQMVDRWSEFQSESKSGKIDRYMILSLFGEGTCNLNLSKGLIAWRKKLFSIPKEIETPVPALRDYQNKGISWINHVLTSGCHCLLADEMGLGKTVQILGVIAHLKAAINKPAVVFCPASVIPVWKSEVRRFFDHLRILHVSGSRSLADFDASSVDIVLCSYTQLRRNAESLHTLHFGCCVLDEAQVIKNPDTKASRACYLIKADHRIAVTGTPIENHYKDIWSIFFFLMPGLMGNRTRFDHMVERGGEGFSQRLRNQLAPFILRRTKAEVIAELPDKNEMQLNCSMTDVQKKEYNRLVQEGLKRIATDTSLDTLQKRSFSFFALLTRLRQVCCDPGLLPWMDVDPGKSAKIQLMVEKLRDIFDTGHKVVIFSQFVGLINRLKAVLEREFPSLNLFVLTGKTVDRAKPVAGFQESPNPAAILVSLKAGGTGITLHAADYVFLLDPWWNPSVEAQAIDRVHRLGQENPVFVYRVIATGTIEERVQALQAEKKEMFRELIEDLKDVTEHKEHLNALRDLVSLQS